MDAFEAVSLPEMSPPSRKKYFSAAEANRALTLVRKVVADIVESYRQLHKLHDTCRNLEGRGKSVEAERARQEYVHLTDDLSELRAELEQIGCELKDYNVGLVDFPARLDGREICLCWKHGEDEVGYWHEVDSGYSGRRPIGAAGFSASAANGAFHTP